MSVTFRVDPSELHQAEAALAAAAEAVSGGLLVVIPTETVYGIACRPDGSSATLQLFDVKGRQPHLSLPVLVPTADRAWDLAEPNPAARALARAFWPGPLTLVLPRTPGSRPWHLGDATGTIAVRVPDHPVCLALLARTGALAATSANQSGQPPLAAAQPLMDTFGEEVAVYLVLAEDAPPPGGISSTVVDLTGASPRVTREGPLTLDDLARVLTAGLG